MKSKIKCDENDLANEIENQKKEKQGSEKNELSIEEQIEIYSELIVDQLIKQLNEK